MKFYLVSLLLLVFVSTTMAQTNDLARIQNAIVQVESGGRDVTGDNGKAIGPLQIHKVCWQDANLPGKYEDCHKLEYALRVQRAYWQRYCPKALEQNDLNILSRVWNGGPKGYKYKSTLGYYKKVKAAFDKLEK